MMFHAFKCTLFALTKTSCWTIQSMVFWNDVMFWFSQIILYKQQEQYVLTTVKEIKYFLVKMLVSIVQQCQLLHLLFIIT